MKYETRSRAEIFAETQAAHFIAEAMPWIKAITGKTPLQLIRDVKMDIARQMLSNHTASVGDVAQKVGYNDHDYFAQTFKDYFGMLPNELIKSRSDASS